MEEQSKGKLGGFWIATVLIVVSQGVSGYLDWTGFKEIVGGLEKLGYPLYLMKILGTWKILGAIALLIPAFPRLKEWAYAGFFFDFTGAAVSHAIDGDAPDEIAPAVILCVF